MKTISLGNTGLQASEIALGCMRITGLSSDECSRLIRGAMEEGINFFDHADIYAGGEAEAFFADSIGMNSTLREQMLIQSKCAIRPGQYDFSKEHILSSVDGSLKRLKTDYLDVLLLHRPDALMEPEEVAEAFSTLYDAGKVRYFGVSNHNPGQIALLNKYLPQKIIVNQLQLSIPFCPMIDQGLNVNMENVPATMRDGSVLDYCRLNDITVQAWSPFQYGFFEGVFIDSPKYPELNQKLAELAEKYDVTKNAIAIAWILRHPAKIQPILGTTNLQRVKDVCKASAIQLTRKEWYELYLSAGKKLP